MKLSRESLNKLNKNIEETKRKRAEVKKEIIIRENLLNTVAPGGLSSIEGLKEENDETEEEIESELIRAGVIEKPKQRKGEQVYQSLQDLFKPENIKSDVETSSYTEGNNMKDLHTYDKTQGRHYTKDRLIEEPEELKDEAEIDLNLDNKQVIIEEKEGKIKSNRNENINLNIKELTTDTTLVGNFNIDKTVKKEEKHTPEHNKRENRRENLARKFEEL